MLKSQFVNVTKKVVIKGMIIKGDYCTMKQFNAKKGPIFL
jgi:hypothetical protein